MLVRLATILYNSSPLKHHATGRHVMSQPRPLSWSEPASLSLTPTYWALSKAAEPQSLMYFLWREETGDRTTNLPHVKQLLNHYTNWPQYILNLKTHSVKYYKSLLMELFLLLFLSLQHIWFHLFLCVFFIHSCFLPFFFLSFFLSFFLK